jgi:glyoxylase-like metal-dependent hydrolase (beta-lactamase superfamily II)
MKIKKFTFNSFQENTYIISSNKECMIIDPGCSNESEKKTLSDYIEHHKLHPIELINTHCHLDHIFGNHFIATKYNLKPKMHKKDLPLLEKSEDIAKLYNVNLEAPPLNVSLIEENDTIIVGSTHWKILFTPGHAPGHICLLNKHDNVIIVGDVLFFMSIGRTDLPGCNHNDLIDSIHNKLFSLDDKTQVLCGHGQNTSIGFEKINNPFLT